MEFQPGQKNRKKDGWRHEVDAISEE